MPPHCDSMDGPVVRAARAALEAAEVALVLPYVPEGAEAEVTRAFETVMPLHRDGPRAREVADRHFFETVVRLHRAGEGAPYTGLKPAGLDVGPVIPVAERAIGSGSAEELVALLTGAVEEEVRARFARMLHLREHAGHGTQHARAYVEAMLGLQVWAHDLHTRARAAPHAGAHEHG